MEFNFSEQTPEQLEERKTALLTEMETPEMAADDLEARKAEIIAIDAELEARKAAFAEQVKEEEAVAEGAGETREDHKEEKPMEISEIRNTPEYINAYANYIKTGRDQECRDVLLSKNAAASGQVPVPDMLEGIIKTAWEKNDFLSRVKKTYFRGNLRVPFELSATGAWVHAEGTTGLTEEAITIGIVELKPENIKKWIRISDEAIDLGGEDFLRYIYDEITYRILKELVAQLVADVTGASASNSSSAIGVPVTKVAPGVMVLPNAATNLSEEATDLCVVMNRLTEAKFNTAYSQGNFAIDPFAGFTKIYTSALPAYDTASENDCYAIVGDLKALQVNYPDGEGVIIKWDDLSLAEDDLVKVVGRQYAGHKITAPGCLIKLTKPGA